MTSRDSFMYIYPVETIISVIKSKSGSKSAEKVCKGDVNICSEPYFDSKNHWFSLCNISGLRGVTQMGLGPKVKILQKIAICPESLGNFEESAKRNQNALGGGRTCKDINSWQWE